TNERRASSFWKPGSLYYMERVTAENRGHRVGRNSLASAQKKARQKEAIHTRPVLL
ncbi:Hypothetical predicted protein, partial [Pelobates cultripes]